MDENAKKLVAHICRMMNPSKDRTALVFEENVMDIIAKAPGKKRKTVFQAGRKIEYKRIALDPQETMVIEYRVGTDYTTYEAYLYEIKICGKTYYKAPMKPETEEYLSIE